MCADQKETFLIFQSDPSYLPPPDQMGAPTGEGRQSSVVTSEDVSAFDTALTF